MTDLPPASRPAVAPTAVVGLFAAPSDFGSDGPICSRKGCRSGAGWQLLWNNPKIHTPERRKAWASCTDHVEWFEEYLRNRGLWKETLPLSPGHPMEAR